jgi:polar amino acid transport system ATP-binding protein
MPLLALRSVRKRFGDHVVLDDVSLDVETGEVVAIIGRSGSGKTTLLRCINGLEKIDGGAIEFEGKPLPHDGAALREVRRHIGIVFQSLNLFPHHSVERNITLGPTVTNGCRCRRQDGRTRRAARGRPRGQAARLSHATVRRPAAARRDRPRAGDETRLMLFDEITSALDPELVGEVVKVLERLAAQHMTMVLVTHEMGFARRTADTLVFMHKGRVWEKGPPKELFAAPKTRSSRASSARCSSPND